MKRLSGVIAIFLAGICFAGIGSYSEQEPKPRTEFQNKNLAIFCKVWGFLKYYHPYPSDKKVNWDNVLIENYSRAINAKSKTDFNAVIKSMLNACGAISGSKAVFIPIDSLARNINFNWLTDTSILTATNSARLSNILCNHEPFDNKYIASSRLTDNPKFNEEPFAQMEFPAEEYRFLALARYWNAIEYYFPSKYLMDHNWDSSLVEAIPFFHNATTKEDYYESLQWITARIDDTHAFYVYKPWHTPVKTPPISTTFKNDSLVVTYIFNDSIASICGIKTGDQIIRINDQPVSKVWSDYQLHHSISNKAVGEFRFSREYGAFITNKDTTHITVQRDGNTIEIKLLNYIYREKQRLWKTPKPKFSKTQIMLDSMSNKKFAYFNLGTLEKDQVDSMFSIMTGVDELILDARNYPKEFGAWIRLANRIVTPRQHIAQMSSPNYDYPGHLKFSVVNLQMGTTEDKAYTGNVYILVDHRTLSQAEYQVMALRQAPHATVIGTQTAGADGNVSSIVLPGNYTTSFSGLGWYYADGRQTQRVGIIPDIKVEYTIQSALARRDPIMEKALELIRTNK